MLRTWEVSHPEVLGVPAMRDALHPSGLNVDRIQDDHADRLLQEVFDLAPVVDVVIRRSVCFERLLAPVSLEQMQRATRVALLVEVVPLAPRFGPRPLDHPREQRAEVARSPVPRMERSEDGNRVIGHAHLATARTIVGTGAPPDRFPTGAVYRPAGRAEGSA